MRQQAIGLPNESSCGLPDVVTPLSGGHQITQAAQRPVHQLWWWLGVA